MNQEMKVLPDGTIEFFHNRRYNLIFAIASITGLFATGFFCLCLNIVDKKIAYIILCAAILVYVPLIIFFLKRFLSPKPILAINEEGIIAPFSLPYPQITTIIYKKRNVALLLKSNIKDLAKNASIRNNCLVFRTQDEKSHNFQIDLLTAENKQVLRDFLEKKGFTYQG